MSNLIANSQSEDFMQFFVDRDAAQNAAQGAETERQQYVDWLLDPQDSHLNGRLIDMSARELTDEVAAITERMREHETRIEELNSEAEGHFLNRKLALTALVFPWDAFEYLDGSDRLEEVVTGRILSLKPTSAAFFTPTDFIVNAQLVHPFRLGLLMTGRRPKNQTELVGVHTHKLGEPMIKVEFCS